MDQPWDRPWWRASPAPALFVRPQPAGFAWEMNEAGQRWAQADAVTGDMLERVARDVGGRGAAAPAGAVGSTPLDGRLRALRWHAMPWSGGWLAWWLPDTLVVPPTDGAAPDADAGTRLKEQVKASVRRATEIETMAGIGCWTLGAGAGVPEWDEGLFVLHGRDPARGAPSYGDWVEEYVYPEDRPRLRKALSAAAHRERKPYTDHCRIVRGDGKLRFLEISGHYAERPEGLVLCGTMADVTDRRSMDDALYLERWRMRFAGEAAGVAAWECSLDGEPLYWNAQMYRLHGLDPQDTRLLKQLWGGAHRPVDLAQLQRATRLHVQQGQPLEHTLRTVWPDGSEHWIAIRGRLLAGRGGRDQRVHGLSWDLTERVRAERDLREQQAALDAHRARDRQLAQLAEAVHAALLDGGPRAAAALGEPLQQLLAVARGTAPAAPSDGADAAGSGATLRPLSLLCVEDSALHLMVVEQLVQRRPNITLHTACSGQAGVEMALALRPDAVLIDLQLPDFDGFEVLRRLRAQPALAGTACIVLSASAQASDIEHALAIGFDAYWTKPVDVGVFLGGLDALARGQGLHGRRAPPAAADARLSIAGG